ncbi:NAD(P)-binding protein [Periconia macrospinosa]|uniref:NAD(P)-binding protein n=1 Tax=Periconia macrospinosa TaxID=97972 RepID=A0A2V1D613_9PLEO|nr:NAD(P)-binding protein [Periconia macrospinosa]
MASTQPLLGKTVLITGGSRGIGATTALHLSSLGAKVVVNYVSNSSAADAIVAKLGADKALAIKADAGNVQDIECLVQETVAWKNGNGKIDILIANAAIGDLTCTLEKTTEANFDRHMAVNVKGSYFLVQKAAPHMPSGSSVILVSSSLTGVSQVMPNYLLYLTTKGAIEQMTRVMAKDLGRKGITVNCVGPGPTATDMFLEGKSEELIKTIASWNPFQRLGKPEEIARVMAWLAGPDGKWVNGQVVKVNGGMAV